VRKTGIRVYHVDFLIPCLQPGTIIHLNNKNFINNYFWYHIRPRIQVPFVLITSDSDFDSPLKYHEDYGDHLVNDTLLLKWYGGNPNYSGPDSSSSKLEPFSLGLSNRIAQTKHLEPYLALDGFANPFPSSSINRINNNDSNNNSNPHKTSTDFDWDRDVFVFFGTKRKRRQGLWDRLCQQHKTNATTGAMDDEEQESSRCLSCNKTSVVSPHEIYEQASRYRFGISPPGMGWDCYRTYEWLYLGVIPIVEERDPQSHRLFQGLPVVQVPDLFSASRKTITRHIQEFLKTAHQENRTNTVLAAPGWKKLFLAYWRRKIWKDAGRELLTPPRHNGTEEYYVSWKYESTLGHEGIYCAVRGNCGRD
jgi:hypothetical protein